LREQVAKSHGNGTLLGSLGESTGDVSHDQRVGDVHATDVDERCTVTGLRVLGGQTDDETGTSDSDGNGVVKTTLLDPVMRLVTVILLRAF
jgi:hypothetical protein